MVAEIVNHLHAVRFATKLQPPRNPSKTLECTVDFRLWHIIKPRRHGSHRCIVDIEFANERDFKSVFAKFEPGTFSRISDVPDSLGAILREANLDHLRQAILCNLDAIGIVAIHEHHSILRNDIEQAPEAELDFVEIFKDVCVIEFDVVYDHQLRQVMNEFGALVEK